MTAKTKNFNSLLFVRSLPNEYLVRIGKSKLKVLRGGSAFRWFRRFLKIPASAEIKTFELECSTMNYLGVIVRGYVAWRIDLDNVELALRSLNLSNIESPLEKTSEIIADMAQDAVRRSIAEIKVDEILQSSDKLKESIESILKDVSRWGLLVDTIGIDKIFIKSENVYNDLQAEDRSKLQIISKLSYQEADSRVRHGEIEKKKELTKRESELEEIKIKEKIKTQSLEQESEVEAIKLEKDKEQWEINLSQKNEASRYEYQKERILHDKELQQYRYEIDLKNIDIIEKRRKAESGLTDRELAELIADRLETISAIYKNSNLTIIGDSTESLQSLVAPIQILSNTIKDFLKTGNSEDQQ